LEPFCQSTGHIILLQYFVMTMNPTAE